MSLLGARAGRLARRCRSSWNLLVWKLHSVSAEADMRAVILIWTATFLYAPFAPASDFAGTWKRDDTKSTLSPAPAITIQPKQGGWHVTWSTGPEYDVIPDGKEHAVPGPSVFETATYHRIDSHTLEQN